jgi:acyl-CoA synthetase (AMP-forming)/AMP-acid ligase II
VHVVRTEAFVMQPRRFVRLLSDVRATVTVAPNFGWELAANKTSEEALEGVRLDALRHGLDGAEPVHPSTVARVRARFGPAGLRHDAILPVYGLAEATLAVTMPEPERAWQTRLVCRDRLEGEGRAVDAVGSSTREVVSVGVPVAGTSVRIAHAGGDTLAENEVGEILVRSASMMSGYHRDERASAAALDAGWLRTGDLGFLDGGRLFVTGRAKEIVIKAGRNLQPYDLERAAAAVDGVAGAVAAFGRPNTTTGTDDLVVVAEVRTADPGDRERIARAIIGEILSVAGVRPDEVAFTGVGALPRTTSGKIRRGECARRFAAGAT